VEPIVEAATVLPEFGRSAVEPHSSFGDEDHSIGERLHFLEDVRREQDRLLLAEPADRLPHLADLVGVEPAGGLVQNQNVGLVQQHLGHPDPLAIPFRELADRLADHATKLALLHNRLDPLPLAVFGKTAGIGKKLEQAAGRHVGIQRAVLRQITEPLGSGDPVTGHVMASDERPTLGRGEVAGQDLHRGALAGTVGAQERHNLAPRNPERDILDGDEVAVELRDAYGLDHGLGGRVVAGTAHGVSLGCWAWEGKSPAIVPRSCRGGNPCPSGRLPILHAARLCAC